MSEARLINVALTTIPTMTVVLIGILLNNTRLNDVKELLRAEIKSVRDVLDAHIEKNQSEMLHRFADLDNRFTGLDSRLTRIEGGLGINRG